MSREGAGQGVHQRDASVPRRDDRRPFDASVDHTEARCEVASGPKTVESPFMLMNLLRY